MEELRLWLLQILGGEAWQAAVNTSAYFKVDLSMLFLGFYGFLAFVTLCMLFLSSSMRGIWKAVSFAVVMLCIVVAGFVAGLSLLDWKITENKNTVKSGANISYRHKPVKIKDNATETALKAIERQQRNEEPTSFEIFEERKQPKWDREGNLVEDDLSHESEYPRQ